MEQAVERVEAMFKEAESGLDYLSRRVEHEFDHCKEEGGGNPATLLRNLADIKKEFSSIAQEAQAIQQAQKEAVDYIKDQLTSACSLLQNLQQQTSLQDNEEKPAELEKLEELLGVKFPDPHSVQSASNHSNTEDTEHSDSTFTIESDTPQENGSCSCPDMSPASKRSQSHEFMELTQEEFESVSTSIRGRLKLTDVNMAYRILWRHFKEEGNGGSVNPSEMYKLGMKVSGTNGQAKLKVLKALNLCTLSRNMEVELT